MSIGSQKYQYLVGIIVNILSLSYGAFCGWPSASFPVLQSNESPLESGALTADQISWIGSVLCIGGAVGTIFFAYTVDRFGRRITLMLIAVPSLIGWLVIPFAQTPMQLGISRFIGGIAGGGAFGVIPLYITEVADKHVRGILGALVIGTANTGTGVAFVLGYYFSYSTVAWIMIVPVVVFLFCFIFLPETPQYLINKNKIDEAEKAFRYLRNIRNAVPDLHEDFKAELQKLKGEKSADQEANAIEHQVSWQDISDPKALKSIFIGIFLMSLNQFCGLFALLSYTATVFEISGSNVSPNMSAIIVGIIQIIGSYTSVFMVSRFARKKLLCGSALGTAFGHMCLGSYIYLNFIGYNVKALSWIPIASFSLAIFIACWGVLPLPFVLIAEIMPPKIRSIGCMLSTLSLWTCAFTMLQSMPFLLEYVGLYGLLFMCGGYCLGSIIFVIAFVPETRGKSVEEIAALL